MTQKIDQSNLLDKRWMILLKFLLANVSIVFLISCSNKTAPPTSTALPSSYSSITTNSSQASITTSQLPTPTPISPGSPNIQAPTVISNFTPTLVWSAVLGADYYQVVINEYTINNWVTIYNSQQVTGTSLVVPAGVIEGGSAYGWSVAAHEAGGWSQFSSILLYVSTEGVALTTT